MELIIIVCLAIVIVWIKYKVHAYDRHMDKIAETMSKTRSGKLSSLTHIMSSGSDLKSTGITGS